MKSKNKRKRLPTLREERLGEAAQRSQAAALQAQQDLRDREGQFTNLCDALVEAGNDPGELRGYWDGYKSPDDRA